MKRVYSILLLGISLMPFVLELPYACRTMLYSSAECWNWCFVFWAALLAFLAVFLRQWKEEHERAEKAYREDGCRQETPALEAGRSLPVWRFASLLPAMFLLLFGYLKQIHLAVLLGGIFLPFALAGFLFGWRKVLPLLPCCGVLMFFCPSIGVFLSTLFTLDGLLLKGLCALAFTALLPCILFCRMPKLRMEALLFGGVALFIACFYWVRSGAMLRHPSLLPVFDNLISKQFRGVEEEISAGDRHFYGDSTIKRFYFNDQNGNTIQVLVLSNIDNVHQVHPTAYCLRVGGYQTMVEHARRLPQNGNCPTAEVLETLAERSEEKRLFWQWFSTPEYSTSNFLLFRTLYSPANDWNVFVIDMRLNGTLEDGQRLLHDFISEFMP